MFIIIVFCLGSDRPSGHLFLSCPLYFFQYSSVSYYLLLLFHNLISFLLFPFTSVWETLVHEFLISYSHNEWYLLLIDSATTSAHFVFGAKK